MSYRIILFYRRGAKTQEYKCLPQVPQKNFSKQCETLPDALSLLLSLPSLPIGLPGATFHTNSQRPSLETALLPQYEMSGRNLILKWITVFVAVGSHHFLQII